MLSACFKIWIFWTGQSPLKKCNVYGSENQKGPSLSLKSKAHLRRLKFSHLVLIRFSVRPIWCLLRNINWLMSSLLLLKKMKSRSTVRSQLLNLILNELNLIKIKQEPSLVPMPLILQTVPRFPFISLIMC